MGKRWRSVLLCSTVAGCGGGVGGVDMAAAPPDMSMSGPETCKSDNMAVALSAHYGVKANLNVNVKVPADGSVFNMDAPASLLLIADITQNGQMVAAHPCTIEIPKVALGGRNMPPTVLTAPDALVQSVKTVNASAKLGGPNTCTSFISDPLAILIGVRLAMPGTDPLPLFSTKTMPTVKLCGGKPDTKCDATMDTGCICDQEGDGKPGATVLAMGIPAIDDVDKVYLGLRTVVALDGMVFPPSPGQTTPGQRIKGQVSGLKLEQSPVGCHRSPAGGGMPIDCDDPTTNQVALLNPLISQSTHNASTFVAMPVPDGYTCANLTADAATLFKGQ